MLDTSSARPSPVHICDNVASFGFLYLIHGSYVFRFLAIQKMPPFQRNYAIQLILYYCVGPFLFFGNSESF